MAIRMVIPMVAVEMIFRHLELIRDNYIEGTKDRFIREGKKLP